MYKNFFKRFIDLTLSVLALIVLSWLYLIIAILIKLTSPGPVLFKQDRIGKDGHRNAATGTSVTEMTVA